jgi:hypothetical protein
MFERRTFMFLRTHWTTTQSPSIDLGRYFTFCPPPPLIGKVTQDNGGLAPDVTQCHVRKMMFRRSKDKVHPVPNIWHIDRTGHQLQACLDEVVQLAREVILPWFAWLDDLDMLLGLIAEGKQDIEGKSRDPMLRGTWEHTTPFGKELLGPVVASGGVRLKKGKVSTMDAAALAVVRAAYERACSAS